MLALYWRNTTEKIQMKKRDCLCGLKVSFFPGVGDHLCLKIRGIYNTPFFPFGLIFCISFHVTFSFLNEDMIVAVVIAI